MTKARNGACVMNGAKYAGFFVFIGRVCLSAASLCLLGAWLTQATEGTLAGLSLQHLFSDSMALSLIGIGLLLGGLLHSKGM